MPVVFAGRAARSATPRSVSVGHWAPAALAVLLLLLCGCGGTSTKDKPALAGVQAFAERSASGSVGSIIVDAAWIPPPPGQDYPAGSGAALGMVIVNNGNAWDRLTSITTPVSSRVVVSQYNIVQDFISLTTDPRQVTAAAQLADLTRTISPGDTVPVTFNFDAAGSVTLDVPVRKSPPVGIGGK